jgi:hypothetical protein
MIADAYRTLLLTAVFLNQESTDLGCGLNCDSDGRFSRQQSLEIRSRFRQPNP